MEVGQRRGDRRQQDRGVPRQAGNHLHAGTKKYFDQRKNILKNNQLSGPVCSEICCSEKEEGPGQSEEEGTQGQRSSPRCFGRLFGRCLKI